MADEKRIPVNFPPGVSGSILEGAFTPGDPSIAESARNWFRSRDRKPGEAPPFARDRRSGAVDLENLQLAELPD